MRGLRFPQAVTVLWQEALALVGGQELAGLAGG